MSRRLSPASSSGVCSRGPIEQRRIGRVVAERHGRPVGDGLELDRAIGFDRPGVAPRPRPASAAGPGRASAELPERAARRATMHGDKNEQTRQLRAAEEGSLTTDDGPPPPHPADHSPSSGDQLVEAELGRLLGAVEGVREGVDHLHQLGVLEVGIDLEQRLIERQVRVLEVLVQLLLERPGIGGDRLLADGISASAPPGPAFRTVGRVRSDAGSLSDAAASVGASAVSAVAGCGGSRFITNCPSVGIG